MRRCIFGCATAALLASGGARAASLEFSPVRVELAPGQMATTIELRNDGATAAVQVRPYAWTQNGDADDLQATGDIIVSPPIFTIQAGDTQIVRLLVRAAGGNSERDYRLVFDELPPPSTRPGIVLALRTSVPVFAAPRDAAADHLQWTAETATGGLMLAARNTGGRSVRVTAVSLDLPGDKKSTLTPVGKDPNVLPGAIRHWLLRDPVGLAPGSALTVRVTAGGATTEETVTLPR